ncbi:MAG TPA: mechanosensitive ion channel family protein, partial [Desulfuromonadaceae bacterium]|nr:mechanosensitive ion channel family protein [Desulfuromonadaceae bacterium]
MKFDFEAFWNGVEAWFLVNGIRAILIVVATIVLLNVIGVVVNKVRTLMEHKRADLESKKRAGTLAEVLRWALRVVLITVAFMLLLEEFHIDIKPMLAAAGVAGIAIGFGAQNLVQDFFAGFFILIEDQIRVGDVVKVNDQSGLVEKITLRMVVLRDYAGSVIYVRNGKIDVVTNMTKDYSYAVFNVSIAYREDVDQVTRVLKGIDDELRNDPAFKDDILAPLEVAGLDSFGDSAIVIKARTMTKPIQQWRIGREFNRRMKKKFDELNIEIPFPHQT